MFYFTNNLKLIKNIMQIKYTFNHFVISNMSILGESKKRLNYFESKSLRRMINITYIHERQMNISISK